MCTPVILLYSLVLAASTATLPQQDQGDAPTTREITVNVQFDTFDDAAVPPLPLYLSQRLDVAKADVLAFALTDDTGKTTLRAPAVPVELDAIFLAFHQSFTEKELYTPAEGLEYRNRIKDLYRKYHLRELAEYRSPMRIDLHVDQSTYDVILHADPAVHLVGAVVSNGRPVYNARVNARAASFQPSTDQNGRFNLFGIPKGEPNELFVSRFPFVTPFYLDGNRTQEDSTLEPIVITEMHRSSEFQVVLENFGELNTARAVAGKGALVQGVTLISTDGEVILWFLADLGKVVERGDEIPQAPHGRYYVAPGAFAAVDIQLGLLDAIRARIDLTDSGIPMIEIKEGEPASLVVDAVEAAAAIERVMKQMEDDSDE